MGLASNTRWIALAQIGRIAFQLIAVFAFARLLSPREYGLIAMIAIVTNFALIIRDLGTSAAVIQNAKLSDKIVGTIFFINLTTGIFLFVFLVVFSGFIARQLGSPELAPALRILAFSFPLSSIASVHQALMERNSRFRELAKIEFFAGLVALLVALTFARLGAGVYSVVAQSITLASLSSLLIYIKSAWRGKLRFELGTAKELFSFSGNLTAFSLLNYFSRNADGLIIGKYLGPNLLGPYSLAYRSMLFPLQSITFVTTRAMYPLLSRSQHDKPAARAIYLRTLRLIIFLVAPLCFGLFSLRGVFVEVFFGTNWALVSDLLLWMAPTGLIQAVVSTTGSIFMANGKTYLQMKLGFISMVLQVSAFVLGVQFGVVEVAKFYFFANILNALITVYFALKILDLSFSSVFRILAPSLLAAAIMSLAIHGVIVFSQLHSLKLLLVGIVVGGLTYLGGLKIFFSAEIAAAIDFFKNKD